MTLRPLTSKSAPPKPAKLGPPTDLPFSIEDPRKLAALADVLGCTPAMARDIIKRRENEAELRARIEALERGFESVLKLIMTKK